MCSYTNHEKAYLQALRRGCLNPDLGKLLDGFEGLIGPEKDYSKAHYQTMIQHLIECRPCRKQLGEMGKYILSAELFWSGCFVNGKGKEQRSELRARMMRTESPRKKIKFMEEVLRKSIQEPWKSELKRIRRFIEK